MGKNNEWPNTRPARPLSEIKAEHSEARKHYQTLEKELRNSNLYDQREEAFREIRKTAGELDKYQIITMSVYQNSNWGSARWSKTGKWDWYKPRIELDLRSNATRIQLSFEMHPLGRVLQTSKAIGQDFTKLTTQAEREDYLKEIMPVLFQAAAKRYLQDHRKRMSALR